MEHIEFKHLAGPSAAQTSDEFCDRWAADEGPVPGTSSARASTDPAPAAAAAPAPAAAAAAPSADPVPGAAAQHVVAVRVGARARASSEPPAPGTRKGDHPWKGSEDRRPPGFKPMMPFVEPTALQWATLAPPSPKVDLKF